MRQARGEAGGGVSSVNPWDVLRAIRDRSLVAATAEDEPINGADAVDELGSIREQIDEALALAPSVWGEPISVYTRADALDDHELYNVTGIAAHFLPHRFESAAITAAAYYAFDCEDYTKRTAVVSVAMAAIQATSDARADFTHEGRAAYVLAHEGDQGEPCATIMLADED